MSGWFDLVPGWAWAAALVGLGLFSGVQTVRLADEKRDHAETRTEVARVQAAREKAAREHAAEVDAVRRQHAEETAEKEKTYAQDLAALAQRRDAALADARGLRSRLAAATARDRTGPAPGPAACERDADRLESLGALAGEGAELLAEARGLLQQRDLEVKRLLDQIAADRAAVERAATR